MVVFHDEEDDIGINNMDDNGVTEDDSDDHDDNTGKTIFVDP